MSGPGPAPTTSRRGLLAGLAVGAPVVAYGIWGALADAERTHPAELARWVVGAALAVDLIVVPAAIVVGAGVRRVCPATWWPVVRAALMAIGGLALVAWPYVRGYGRDPANSSLLSRDYAAGLAGAIGVVVGLTVVALTARSVAERRRRDRPSPTSG